MIPTSALGWALVHFLWQGTLIAVAARALLALLANRSAALRYVVAVVAMAIMPLAVAVTMSRALGAPAPELANAAAAIAAPEVGAPNATPTVDAPAATEVAADETERARPAAAWRARVQATLPGLVTAWALGALLLALRLLFGLTEARRLMRVGTARAPETLVAMTARLVARLRVRQAVQVCTSTLARVPAVVGWLSPIVLIPTGALMGLTPVQLEAIIAHELAHVRRHDYLVNLVQSVVETLLFYHPAIWWLGARVREEREHCCDDLAVGACGSAPLYAEALLTMERLRGAPDLAMAASGGSLLSRVERLLLPRATQAEVFPRWLAGVAVATVVIAVGWAPLASAAGLAQERSGSAMTGQAADTVIRHPDPSQPLERRTEWAITEAANRRYGQYWVGHAIDQAPTQAEPFFMGRFSEPGWNVGEGVTIVGHFFTNVRNTSGLPGRPLAPQVGADGRDVGVLYLYSGRGARAEVRRITVATASVPVDFGGMPVFWLGKADDRQSVALARRLLDAATNAQRREDLVSVIGVHGTSSLVVPILTELVDASNETSKIREEAVEWLGHHPTMDALAVLARTARNDRVRNLRREAAESVAEQRFAPAYDTLVALARELTDRDARSEAVEGLGERQEPGAASELVRIANEDPDEGVRREAVETLGDLSGRRGVAALQGLLTNSRFPGVRSEAAETIAGVAPARDAIAILSRVARDDRSADVRREAVESLGEIDDPAVVGVLADIARQDDIEAAREAVETLGDLSAHDRSGAALEAIAGFLRSHPQAEVRAEAAETYGENAPPARAAALFIQLLETERSEEVRSELLESLAELKDAAGIPALVRIAREHADPEVRAAALHELGDVSDPRGREAVRRLLRTP